MSIENELATDVAGADTAASETNDSPSMEDSIARALEAHPFKTDNDTTDEVVAEEGEAEVSGERQRGPNGKFLAKANGQAAAEPAEALAAEQTAQTVAPKPHDAVPNTWKKEFGTEFGKLPENVRQEIHRREQDFLRGIGQYKEAAGFGQTIAQELLPYQQIMQQHNAHPRDVLKNLMPAYKTLVTGSPQDKANLILQLVKEHGIDFASLGTDSQQSTAQTTQEDPRLATALQRIEKLEGNLTAQERQRAEAEYSANVDAVTKFGSDPAHKHFPAVREQMSALIKSGQANDLNDAYDKAMWIVPEVRASLLAEQEQERANKLAAEAANARKAAGANVARRGTPPVKPTTGKIEDTIGAQLAKHGW